MVANMPDDDHQSSPMGSPLKRARTMKHLQIVQRISRSILQSITQDQRTQAFLSAQKAFDHKTETLHDIEVQEGIVSSLCLQLGYILNRGSSEGMDLASIFSIIALVYQCSDEVRAASFAHVGNDLLKMMFCAFKAVQETEYFGWCSFHIMKVMRSLSRLKDASLVMVQEEDALTILQIVILDNHGNLGAKLEAIATLKNLTFYAEDDRLGIMHHPGMIDALIRTCSDRGDDTGREFASAVIRNLAMAPDTKVEMVEISGILDILVQLMDDQNLKTRRNAVSAIGSLAIADENSMIFVTHGEGVILRTMQRLVEEEEDSVIRRRAARALRCFGRKDTVEMIVDRRGIVESLCGVAMNDPSVEAQIEAIEALAAFVSHAHALAPFYNTILDAIVNIAGSSPPTSCVEALAKTMNALSFIQHHRRPMVEHNDFLLTMTVIASDISNTSSTCREQCASAINNLSCDEGDREHLIPKHIVSFLIFALSHEFRNERLMQTYAVKALVNLAKFEKNRKSLAHEKGLLSSLIDFITESPNSSIQEDVKNCLLDLIPLL